ncbi:MAG: Gfo/Idh/MocA family oxidoreductase [Anaerolineae bacterium]|nr:Gfo/Idh/MocA family oxidoreductase [Anaerolineae bacterium]NUQ03260.1 Gfo/Idh/MocA family oxidoreductase [Anaerolineae bacterium]
MTDLVNIAVVGSGYWGPNLIRNIAGLPNAALHTVCDLNPKALAQNAQRYLGIRTTPDYAAVLADPEIHAVVLATPAHLHAEMARAAIEAGKHVMVEKPLSLHANDAQALVELAAAKDVRLMVGHVFIYNPAVIMLRRLVQQGDLGKMLYVYSARLNLGIVRDDLNAMWNLAPHDFSIINYVLDSAPVRVSARGFRLLGRKLEDVAFVTLEYPGGVIAHVHVSWLDPGKVRKMTFVGDQKMVVYDDVSQDERIRIYDRGVMPDKLPDAYGEFRMITRGGDVQIPRLDTTEPLRAECAHFVESIRNGSMPLTSGQDGYRVVQMLEAAQQSMDTDGVPVDLA